MLRRKWVSFYTILYSDLFDLIRYLLSGGIAHLAADYVWQTTAEGDWIILLLQVQITSSEIELHI